MPVYLDGIGQLQRTLRRAGADMGEFRAANRAAASVVARAAQPLTPRRTGRLAATVRAAGSTTRAGVVRAGNNRSVPYAGPIHWGWRARGIAPSTFLSTAARASEPEWMELYTAHVHRIIREIEGR